ncbi:MAG: sensor histidine kinase [Candidatus Contendobacter sp.]|nr:sensor histidine kinase [Candidatus Contendobacter sp.]
MLVPLKYQLHRKLLFIMSTINPIELWARLVEAWGGQTKPTSQLDQPFPAVSRLPLRLANESEIGHILAVFLLEDPAAKDQIPSMLAKVDADLRSTLRGVLGHTLPLGDAELISLLGLSLDEQPVPDWLPPLQAEHGARLMCYTKSELEAFARQHSAIYEQFFGTVQQELARTREILQTEKRENARFKRELERYEYELKTVAGMERRLAQAQAWQELLSITQHKLNTTIGFLKGIVDRHRASTPERWDSNVFDKLHAAVNDLQDRLAMLEGRTVQALERREYQLTEIVEALRNLAKSNGVTFNPRAGLRGAIQVDLKGLQHCVEELIGNAKYWIGQQPNPTITLNVQLRKLPLGHVMLEISCQDNGPGVEDSDKLSIFEPFITGRLGGKGLGLHMVKRFCEIHHGEVYENGKFNQGAHFVMRLPMQIRGTADE